MLRWMVAGRDTWPSTQSGNSKPSKPMTKAVAVFLRHEVKLSCRDVRKVFSGLFGMPFVPASAMNFDHQIARWGQSLHEDLRAKIRLLSIAHGDETHRRMDGQSAQLWYAGNPELAFFLVNPSRAAEVAVSIFGSNLCNHPCTRCGRCQYRLPCVYAQDERCVETCGEKSLRLIVWDF